MRGEIEAIRAGKRKAKAQRDNWKARYVALDRALRELAETWRRERDFLATGGSPGRARMYDDFASLLLAKIDAAGKGA